MFSWPQPAPIVKAASATLTIAELMGRRIQVTGTVAVNLTLPTGTLCDAGMASGNLAVDQAFQWSVMNTGTVSALTTLLAGTGHTIIGSALVAIATSGLFETRKSATNTFITYRLA
jgi:pheromone shutdown protein TraB